ncbi:uncharacterized protein [Typha angustifolia]|uniref:uncharacterized protein n=1 Tax=Typha angustifolia TaxID=59011 RepID=UPI003C30B433
MASSSARVSNPTTPSLPVTENPRIDLLKEMRGHEVAVTELNNLPPSRAVYQKNGNIFFRKNIKSAIAFEQKQVDLAKARLQNLNAA